MKGDLSGGLCAEDVGILGGNEQRNVFLARIAQIFLRQHAYVLPPHGVKRLVLSLNGIVSRKRKKDYFDWKILRADLALNLLSMNQDVDDEKGHGDDFLVAHDAAHWLMKVALALGVMECWEETAALFVEVGSVFPETPYCHRLAA